MKSSCSRPVRGYRAGRLGTIDTGRSQRRADATTDRALAWLGQARGAPYFLWVHYFDPHDTEVVPPDDLLGAATENHARARGSDDPLEALGARDHREAANMD